MSRFLRFATLVLLAVAAVSAGTVVYFSDQPEASGNRAAAVDANAAPALADGMGQQNESPSELVGNADNPVPDELPASLEGTSLPGGWAKTDSHGSLIPTPQLRQLFEYYLAALGEETLPQLIARIEQALARLDEPARSEAMDILGNYLDYKLALGDLEASYDNSAALSAEEMQQQMAEIRALRRSWMDARTADAFFASDEAVDQFQVEQLRIRTDESLSDEQREQALAKAEQSLPEPLREARRETRKFADYQQARTEFADDPEALRAWREERFGEEASRQLEAAEAEQQAWEQKWQAYSEELAGLEDLGVSGPEREAAIDSLRDEYFEGAEKLRAEALDSIR
ncbi:lipase secretion chaperone [Marinobacter sp. HL-58]|uniref:lipase secretion chaperone n=1 Tax=Marinobacter sp. HL-58 TaxID=1479237 RepID=UPI000486A244|nr:lipase secretion chaperone [Marinobacter sp. HL-58]KPQ02834.1 MAG: lipase chaperone LipB [Marinobacter sp. HL-58]